jgi:hypothetical protein
MPLGYEIPAPSFLGARHTNFARNDVPAHGAFVRNAIARQLNHLLALHGTQIPGKALVSSSQVTSTDTDQRLWTTYYRSTPNGTKLRVTVRCLPNSEVGEFGSNPNWYIKLNGTSQDRQYHNVINSSAAGFAGMFEMTQILDVSRSTLYQVDLYTDDFCRVVGWDLCEEPRQSIVVGTDTVADYTYALPLSPILASTIASIRTAADAVFQKMRGYSLAWHCDKTSSPVAVSSTSATYLWDSAGTVASYVATTYRNTYANENLLGGVANKSIPMVIWAMGERTAGAGNVIVRFISGNHGGGVDLNITSSLGLVSNTAGAFTVLPGGSGDTVKVQYLVSAGGTTGNIYDVGCFPLI